jgi:hypothetical protein
MGAVVICARHRFKVGWHIIALIFVAMVDNMSSRDRPNLALVHRDVQVICALLVVASLADTDSPVIVPVCAFDPALAVGKHMT